ncbi:MAG: Rho termination factor N-terminal domain-containing protein [Solirubrobacteraceae bacterium]
MSVLDRSALEASPLADLHTIASELSIDGYRRLRKAELIDVIVEKQGGSAPKRRSRRKASDSDAAGPAKTETTESETTESETAESEDVKPETARPARSRTRARAKPKADEADAPEAEAEATETEGSDEDEADSGPRRRRGRRGGRGRSASRDNGDTGTTAEAEESTDESETSAGEEVVEGVVELLANGSGFVRVDPPEPSDDDVYISSAQVKRCELVSGDRIAGPKRAPRRSERFASLIRIETINGRPAAELADSVRFDDLPAAFASERIKLGSEDPTLKAIEFLTPFGKGSRVTIVGRTRAGKTEVLRRLAGVLAADDGLSVSVVLAGVRPEEISEWNAAEPTPVAAVTFAASDDARSGAIEPAIDQGRRLAARGADAVVLIDTLDGAGRQLARKAMASARNIIDGGSLTVIATAAEPVGGETTVVALDADLAAVGSFPALDLTASGTIRPELLVGEAGAEAIAKTRAEAGDRAAV